MLHRSRCAGYCLFGGEYDLIKVAIVDDEWEDFQALCNCINQYAEEKEIDISVVHFASPLAFLAKYKREYDLIFLDIQMPEKDGLETAREIRKKDEKTAIIFVTNMAQYAVSGYEVDAIDFIVKPVNYYNFYMRMNKAMRVVGRNMLAESAIITAGNKQVIPSSSVIYVEVVNHDIILHSTNGVYRMRMQLKEIERQVPQSVFYKCNVCYLVNLDYVSHYSDNCVYLKNGESLVVSRARKKDFLKVLARHMGGSK